MALADDANLAADLEQLAVANRAALAPVDPLGPALAPATERETRVVADRRVDVGTRAGRGDTDLLEVVVRDGRRNDVVRDGH